ncbi:MAG: hypothetical protein JWL76_1061 [Thermoleophilia bacterium]|nr:hypothetical protein [Thermoleophilia bacterium]
MLLVALSLVLGGCAARQSQDQYEDRLEQALAVRSDVGQRLEQHSYADAQAYELAAQEVLGSLDELDADPPPRNLQHAHESMVSGMEGLSALLDRLGRCEALATASAQDRRACRQSIGQDVYDAIRNDFDEANTIYREEGLALPGLGGDEGAGDSLGEDPEGGDEL